MDRIIRAGLLATAVLIAIVAASTLADGGDDSAPTEAPTSFMLVTNGLTTQDEFDTNLKQFSEPAHEGAGDEASGKEGGLGPTFNATSCADCHMMPSIGGSSQIIEMRAGRFDGIAFVPPPGGTLIRQRAVRPDIVPQVPDDANVVAFRASTSLFGLGYVDAISDVAILNIQANQPGEVRGTAVMVDVTLGVNPDGTLNLSKRIGRFGWKCQNGSLADFALDANFNEKGITSVRFPKEAPLPDGTPVDFADGKADPEDEPSADAPLGVDAKAYTRFMRALKAPPRNISLVRLAADEVKQGATVFEQTGCAQCHVSTWITAPVGSSPRGSQAIPDALGNKIIHPYSDYMLHNVGTGDGIYQVGPPETKDMIRTAPLWGIGARNQFMHDGRSVTLKSAILRHAGQAQSTIDRYKGLSDSQKRQLDLFLRSL